ncbi:hypothetical protein A5672_03740 [Mycobacterium alsense]|uniref:Glycosyltransferase RgtA/B/C/D-like domain-containing protein n=1 Tax=Mycobacterium alsense TaxID=324058 RepID=A0ABD6NVH3_9MYCO|nr:hypothetical protein A5672_03740 [Mycobacterium alsense]
MSPQAERLEPHSKQAGLDAPLPVETAEPPRASRPDEPTRRRGFAYAIVGLLVLLYLASWVVFASVYQPNLPFFPYYAVDYSQGLVRRGLGGEILNLLPADLYFTDLLILRWLVPALFGVGIAAVAWTVAVKFGRSERRLMLALLTAILPLGFVHAVVLPTPDLIGEAALAVFAVVLASAKGHRALPVTSAIYGMTIAVLTLLHEAVPFLQALGAVLAIVVLAHSSAKSQRRSALLAVAPGLAVALAIALLRRQDVSSHCDRLPHRAIRWASGLTPSGEHAYVDYHDWTCRFITVTTRQTPFIGPSQIGWSPLIMSTVAGMVIVALTMVVISRISGVPFARFRQAAQGRLSWVTLAALLLLPVFATSADWTRWWIAVSFDVGVVYLLYASRQPESARSATRRTRVFFAVAIVFFALSQVVAAINTEQSVRGLVTHCSQLVNDPMWVGICP